MEIINICFAYVVEGARTLSFYLNLVLADSHRKTRAKARGDFQLPENESAFLRD